MQSKNETIEENQRRKNRIINVAAKTFSALAGSVLFAVIKQSVTKRFVGSHPMQLPAQKPTNFISSPKTEEFLTVLQSQSSAIINTPKPPINGGMPFPVKGGLRTMTARNASPEKRALAEMLGITLGDHQTLVSDFVKNKAAT